MSKVFHARESQAPLPLERIVCSNEIQELQDRLASQPELLAGDQIRPDDPRRWLLIRREMPVSNPMTAVNEFSLDFLYADQDAIPTLVEVKRCGDPRARREVVGQMLEYAANGRAYWTATDMMQAFIKTHDGDVSRALEELKQFRSESGDTLENFFGEIAHNLQKGILRLVFFLEDSPFQLRSIAEFLNEEFETIEVFIVEARQYRLPVGATQAGTIIAPHVVGFTEAVRVMKQRSQSSKRGQTTESGEANFWKYLSSTSTADELERIKLFIEGIQQTFGCKVIWLVSCITLLPELLPKRGLFGIRKSGELEIYIEYWAATRDDVGETQIAARIAFLSGLRDLGILSPSQVEQKFPLVPKDVWLPRVSQLTSLIERVAQTRVKQNG